MSNNPGTEPKGSVAGAPAANQDASKLASPSTSSTSGDLKALETLIEGIVERKTQSVKDKRIAEMQGNISDFQKRLTRYEQLVSSGSKPEQALSQMQLEEDVQALKAQVQATPQQVSPSAQAGTQGTATGTATSPVLSAVIAALGVDPNSPAVTEALREADDTAAIRKLAALGLSQNAATPAQKMPGMTTTAAPGPGDIDSIVAEMQKLQKNPSKDMKRYLELSNQLKQAGIG